MNTDALKKAQEPVPEESKGEGEAPEKKEMIQRVGQILNENGEWEEYVEEDDPDRPPIAYTYMGSEGLPIEDDDENSNTSEDRNGQVNTYETPEQEWEEWIPKILFGSWFSIDAGRNHLAAS